MKKVPFYLSLLCICSLFSDSGVDTDLKSVDQDYTKQEYKPKGPYLTGPLLTASAYTIPKGMYNIEPYVFVVDNLGTYGPNLHLASVDRRHHVAFVGICQLGLSESVDISIIPQYLYCYSVKADSHSGMGDVIIGPSFQILKDEIDLWDITWKVGLNQLFPCGKYANLDDDLLGNDVLGSGVWTTTLYTAGAKLFHLYHEHFLATRAAFSTILYVPADLKGKTGYGGDATTDGTLYRGYSVVLDIGIEYTMTLHWALALDIENQFTSASYFRGTTIEPVGNDEDAYILSFSPAIEYNWNEHFGAIAGVWISAYGKNADQFFNFVTAVNFYF